MVNQTKYCSHSPPVHLHTYSRTSFSIVFAEQCQQRIRYIPGEGEIVAAGCAARHAATVTGVQHEWGRQQQRRRRHNVIVRIVDGDDFFHLLQDLARRWQKVAMCVK